MKNISPFHIEITSFSSLLQIAIEFNIFLLSVDSCPMPVTTYPFATSNQTSNCKLQLSINKFCKGWKMAIVTGTIVFLLNSSPKEVAIAPIPETWCYFQGR